MSAMDFVACSFMGAIVATAAFVFLREAEWVRAHVGMLLRVRPTDRAGPLRDASPRRTRERIMREMPTFLDILTLGLSAGLSFDASVELYCARYRTTLAERMSNAMLAWRLGACGRDEALEQIAIDADVPAMRRFAATVGEALAFGSPLAGVLEHQAESIRAEQQANIEEEIERMPVKMLIPLGTLIVPAMLLAILGPLLGPALGM